MISRMCWEGEVTGTSLKARGGTERENADMPGKKAAVLGMPRLLQRGERAASKRSKGQLHAHAVRAGNACWGV